MQQVTCKSHQGMRRKTNEDSMLCMHKERVYAVADGVGGHRSGKLASSLATNLIESYIRENSLESLQKFEELKTYFIQCISHVNQVIYELANNSVENEGMATTLVLLYCKDGQAFIANIGDSRAYLLKNSRLNKITEDHTLVNELLKQGRISQEEADNHPNRNMITRALGSEPHVEADFYQIVTSPGDCILLCTDGLYNEIEEIEITRIAGSYKDTESIAEDLIKLANKNGGNDNITVICVKL